MSQVEFLPWQHDLFESLARRLQCRLHFANIDGVIVLSDLAEGRNIIKHRASIIAYLDHLYDGAMGACVIARMEDEWVGIEVLKTPKDPPLFPITEVTMAGAIAQAQYYNGINNWSKWCH